MGMLVKSVGVSGKGEDVFVVAGGEVGGGEGQDRFKDDLSRCAA